MRDLIYGVRQQGKSTLALNLAMRARTPEGEIKPIIIFDPNAQYCCFPCAPDLFEFAEWLYKPAPARSRIIVYRPSPRTIHDEFTGVTQLLRGKLWDYKNYVLICDEASSLQRPSYMHPQLETYLRQAPPDIDVIQTCHRQVDVHTLGRTLVTDTFFFYTFQERELDLAAAQYGDEVAGLIQALGLHQFIHVWSEYGRQRYAIVRDSARWYTAIGPARGTANTDCRGNPRPAAGESSPAGGSNHNPTDSGGGGASSSGIGRSALVT